jgi:hypothetical protein
MVEEEPYNDILIMYTGMGVLSNCLFDGFIISILNNTLLWLACNLGVQHKL